MAFGTKASTLVGLGRRKESLAIQIVRSIIGQIEIGQITVELPSHGRIEHCGDQAGPSATLVIHRWRAIWRLISQGDISFAEAYFDGEWSSPNLAALLELAARNISVFDHGMSGSWFVRMRNRLMHLLRANSRSGSRKNISFHYDLGNDFYKCWLDPSMTYSSALYTQPEQTLEAAQDAKLSRVVELMNLSGGERVLEIGCGWGALAVRLAQSDARVTGVTLSSEQLAFARGRVEKEGLSDRIKLELADYRDVEGSYDRIVSIEMLEAVGEAYWPAYFKTLHQRLDAGGSAVLQAITIDEPRFEAYRQTPDFIQRHIFPGGMLPTKEIIAEQAEAAGLQLVSTQCFGEDYARTLADWRRRFMAAWPRIGAMGFPDRFRRLWEYYLCYCEAGFSAGTIDVGFYVLAKR